MSVCHEGWTNLRSSGGFSFFSVTLFVRSHEAVGIGEIRAEAGVGAQVDGAAAVFGLWKKFRVGAEDASADRHEGIAA